MKKILSVTIGIPAHNEEKNIGYLLDSILKQKKGNYVLQSTIVACDGCTDKTAKIVKKYQNKYKLIKLIDDTRRLGKSERINKLYIMNKSDILVTIDSDVVFANRSSLQEIINCFNSQKIGLVGGHDIPYPPRNLFEKIATVADQLWYETRKDFNNGSNVQNYHACISAIRREVSQKIHIPPELIADDGYIYFRTFKLGYKFRFAKNALVYYRAPNNLEDYLKQTSRFLSLKSLVAKHFGQRVYQYYRIPLIFKIKALLKISKREPWYLILAIFLQIFIRIAQFKQLENKPNGLWPIIQSSKSIFFK